MIGGAYAMQLHAGVVRDAKDLDVFCTAGDFPALLRALGDAGFETEITDDAWLGKARHGDHFVDLIFSSANRSAPVDSVWLERAQRVNLFGRTVLVASAEEVIWSKSTVQDRDRVHCDDVVHITRRSVSHLEVSHLLDPTGTDAKVPV